MPRPSALPYRMLAGLARSAGGHVNTLESFRSLTNAPADEIAAMLDERLERDRSAWFGRKELRASPSRDQG